MRWNYPLLDINPAFPDLREIITIIIIIIIITTTNIFIIILIIVFLTAIWLSHGHLWAILEGAASLTRG